MGRIIRTGSPGPRAPRERRLRRHQLVMAAWRLVTRMQRRSVIRRCFDRSEGMRTAPYDEVPAVAVQRWATGRRAEEERANTGRRLNRDERRPPTERRTPTEGRALRPEAGRRHRGAPRSHQHLPRARRGCVDDCPSRVRESLRVGSRFRARCPRRHPAGPGAGGRPLRPEHPLDALWAPPSIRTTSLAPSRRGGGGAVVAPSPRAAPAGRKGRPHAVRCRDRIAHGRRPTPRDCGTSATRGRPGTGTASSSRRRQAHHARTTRARRARVGRSSLVLSSDVLAMGPGRRVRPAAQTPRSPTWAPKRRRDGARVGRPRGFLPRSPRGRGSLQPDRPRSRSGTPPRAACGRPVGPAAVCRRGARYDSHGSTSPGRRDPSEYPDVARACSPPVDRRWRGV